MTGTAGVPESDLDLLRTYEPVIRYTRGELFFPSAIEPYLAATDLLAGTTARNRRVVLPVGAVTSDVLAGASVPPGEQLFLRLVQRPLDGIDMVRWRNRAGRPHFRRAGRLARVGLFARLIDAGFNASLLLRGTVPGGTAAAAERKYGAALGEHRRYTYHARVIRQGGWIVLHYLYFYWMNDWRSSFYGANDHEADLEQVFVVLEDGPVPTPVWLGCAAHEHSGDQLRRRWDDPGLQKVGTHPVVHTGAGSHASYVDQGEYVTTVPLPALRPIRKGLDGLRVLWRDVLRQADPGDLTARFESALSIPFVDYARGDGRRIGAGGEPWEVVLVSDATPWLHGYRGLWGLDTRDRFGGERAPAGPKYTRAGAVRQSWNDPLGFLGLTKMAPPGRRAEVLGERIEAMIAERGSLVAEVERRRAALPALEAEADALGHSAALVGLYERRCLAVSEAAADLARLERERSELDDTIEAAGAEVARIRSGDVGDPRGHLRGLQLPEPPSLIRYGRLVEAWSAVSASLLLVVVVALLYLGNLPVWTGVGVTIVGFVLLEALFRRHLLDLLLRTTILLAFIGAVILLVTNATLVLVTAILVVAFITLADNVGEIVGR